MGGTDGERVRCEFLLIELNPTYFVAKFELARCFVEKVGQRQRLCNCVNSQILRATHRQREGGGGRFVNFFDRSKPYLCFGQI